MRHVLTNVVGARDQVEVHVRELSLLPGDRLLLCSDGLHEPMTDDLIAPVLGGEADVQAAATRLVREALERGSRDNVTALVVDVGVLEMTVGTAARGPAPAAPSRRLARAHRPLQDHRVGIGRGAMGVVYSGRDERTGRPVALKVMMTDLEGDKETRERFNREANVAGKMVHRNIINVYEAGEEDGRLYMVMELLEGETLNDYMKRVGNLPLEHALDLMMQVCEGLAIAHAHAIVHRDIKPGNLFVMRDGGLKILDFGVARLANSSMTASGFIVGTPDFMSPEQARGRRSTSDPTSSPPARCSTTCSRA